MTIDERIMLILHAFKAKEFRIGKTILFLKQAEFEKLNLILPESVFLNDLPRDSASFLTFIR